MTDYAAANEDSLYNTQSRSLDEISISDSDAGLVSNDEEDSSSKDFGECSKGKLEGSLSCNCDESLPVSKVLLSDQILHIHANQDIVGASKAEDHMTKCALQDVFVDNVHSQDLAVHCKPVKSQKVSVIIIIMLLYS